MAGAVRPRIPQITSILIADRIDRKSVNPAHVNQADLVFIRRAAVVPQLAVRELQREGLRFHKCPGAALVDFRQADRRQPDAAAPGVVAAV